MSKKDKSCCNPKNSTSRNKWRIDPLIGGIIAATVLLLVGIVFIGSNVGNTAQVSADDRVELSVESNTHDWGEIDIDSGIVSKRFVIENTSDATLKLYDVKTSCMCTTAQLITEQQSSKKFGMHEKAANVFEVGPGETTELLVEFDPAFHGPSGVGDIRRSITINTNDPNNPQLSFELSALVVKK